MRILPQGGLPDGGSPTLVQSSSPCAALFADDSYAYCGPPGKGPLARIGSDANVTTLVSLNGAQPATAVDATYVYFTDIDPTTRAYSLLKVPKQGGTPSVVYNEGIGALAVDDSAVYWEYQGAIKRLLK